MNLPPSNSVLNVDDTLTYILEALRTSSKLTHALVPIHEAKGRVLASHITARHDVPSHTNSAVDGYALSGTSLQNGTTDSGEVCLEVIGNALAGKAFDGAVLPGQTVRIMTGATLPIGADTVVMQEMVQTEKHDKGSFIRIPTHQLTSQIGKNIRYAGEDLQCQQTAISQGTLVNASVLGLIASLGIFEVEVYRRLKIAIFSTGDELLPLEAPLTHGQIYDSNRYTLSAFLTHMGFEVMDLGIVPDDPKALEEVLTKASTSADVVITTGGISLGEADFIRKMRHRWSDIYFWKIKIKPGRPLAFGQLGKAWLFGLPGNPVAAIISFLLFVQNALWYLSGRSSLPIRPLWSVRCDTDLVKRAGLREYRRGILRYDNCKAIVSAIPYQGSSVLRSVTEANCLIVLPENITTVKAGQTVQIQMFEGLMP